MKTALHVQKYLFAEKHHNPKKKTQKTTVFYNLVELQVRQPIIHYQLKIYQGYDKFIQVNNEIKQFQNTWTTCMIRYRSRIVSFGIKGSVLEIG